MGRHRKPIEHHKRDGTYQPCRHAGPEPEVVPVEMPVGLDGYAAAFWEAVAPVVNRMGVYTESDHQSLKLMCEAYANYRKCQDRIEEDGMFVTRTNRNEDYLAEHPALRVMSRHWKELVYLLRKFGMTPSDRTGLHVGDKDDGQESDLEKLLGGGRLN